MALNIMSEEAYQLASELAEQTGETLTQAVITALRKRLERSRARPAADDDWVEEVMLLAGRFSRLPALDSRSPEEIIGYDGHGVPR